MTAEAARRVLAASMADLGGSIAGFAEDLSLLDVPPHPLDVVEGHRLFLRYLSLGLDRYVERTDPAYPAFHQPSRDGVRKFAGDSPGQLYDTAPVSATHEYVVEGNMTDTELIELGLYAGDLSGENKHPRRLVASLTEADLDVAADGSFAVRLDRTGDQRNALLLDDDAVSLTVRRYLRDPQRNRPQGLRITRTSTAPGLLPVDAETLASGMTTAIAFARHNVRTWSEWTDRIRATKQNRLGAFEDSGDLFTPSGHSYLDGYWALGPDEALTIEFVPPVGGYWSNVSMNYWMESFEWRFGHRVFATSFDSEPDRDGVVRLVLAERDPAIPGHIWLATLGHREGMMAFRLARYDGPAPTMATAVIDARQSS